MTEPAWIQHAIWWQVYPLGFVGAYPADEAPTVDEHRLRRIIDWLDHAIELGASGIALGPLFASRTHGYDTTDHYRIDPRLGDDTDFDRLVDEAHRRGLRVLLDGVFNHVGTDFARYRDAIGGGPDHPASAWFRRRGNDFDTFEGHGELIALNHDNPEVVAYVADVMTHWLGRGSRRLAPRRRLRRSRPVLGAGAPPGSTGLPRRVVRRRGHSRRLPGARPRRRLRLGDPVRAVEGHLE